MYNITRNIVLSISQASPCTNDRDLCRSTDSRWSAWSWLRRMLEPSRVSAMREMRRQDQVGRAASRAEIEVGPMNAKPTLVRRPW